MTKSLVLRYVLPAIIAALIGVICSPFYIYAKRRKALLQLPHVPISNPFLGNIPSMPALHERPQNMVKWSQIYGKTGAFAMFVGPIPILEVVGPEVAKEILNSSQHTSKGFVYDSLLPWLGTGLLTSDGHKWKDHRRLITPAFHFEVLVRFLDVMNEQAEIMVDRLKKHADKGDSFDIFLYITACALDIICETAMGKKVNAQAVEGHTEYVDAIYEMSTLIVKRFENPLYRSDFFFSLSSKGRRQKQLLEILHSFTRKVIKERKQLLAKEKESPETRTERRPAFLDILLQSNLDGQPMPDEDIREEVDTFMFEGHDTTSASLAWTAHLLGLYPEIQETCYNEIREVMGDSKYVTYEMLKQFKYLEMVIKESLRVYPSVPFIGRKLTDDIIIDGVAIPKGTDVGISIYTIHHNPLHWENPEKFDPERWSIENSKDRDPYSYIPFSAGARNCIGQKFASNEEKVVLAILLLNYKITTVNKDSKMLPELILRPMNGTHVKIESRKKSA